jgi:hypothetical protein
MTGSESRGIVLQPRDEHLLRELASMRIVDREQAKLVAGFGSTTRANARLLALYREGLLRRLFQGTIAGGRKALYALSPKGARLIGSPTPARLHYSDGELIATNFFVAHQLRLNSVYCAVRYQPIPIPGISFARWVNFLKPVAPRLTPDGYFELTTPEGVLASFVEVDLGYEGSAVWEAKVGSYVKFAGSGDFAKQLGQSRFRVVVIATRQKRAQLLAKLIRRFTDKVFWLASFEVIDRDGFWSQAWLRPSDRSPKGLL